MKIRILAIAILLLSCAMAASAADTVLTWPADGKEPWLKFTIGKLRAANSYSGQTDYVGEAAVENLGPKPVPFASFYIYLFDKNHKRIGEGYLELSNLGPGQQVKVPLTAHAIGTVAALELQPQHLPSDEPVKVKLSVTSSPTEASLKIDGQYSGVTPQMLSLAPGKHMVEISKEGYAPGSTPFDLAAGSPLASVNLELNPLTQDTVVLRDGSVILGDVSAVTLTSVTVNVKGKPVRYERNQVARILFIERKPPAKPAPPRSGTRRK